MRLRGSLYRHEFLFCTRWAELHIFVNKIIRKLTFSCFCLTKQNESVVLILPALQNNSTGSVLTNDGRLVRESELKSGVAALAMISCMKALVPRFRPLFGNAFDDMHFP